MTLGFQYEIDQLVPDTFCAQNFDVEDAGLWNFNKIFLPDQKENEIHYRHRDALYCYKRLLYKGDETKFFGLHRDDGWPAYITRKQIHWFQVVADRAKSTTPECHRIGGPSSLIVKSYEMLIFGESLESQLRLEYCKEGKWHREDGPAIVGSSSGFNLWYLDHKFVKKEKI